MLCVALRIAGQLVNGMVAPSLNGVRRAKASGAIGYANRERMIMKITTIGIDRANAVLPSAVSIPTARPL